MPTGYFSFKSTPQQAWKLAADSTSNMVTPPCSRPNGWSVNPEMGMLKYNISSLHTSITSPSVPIIVLWKDDCTSANVQIFGAAELKTCLRFLNLLSFSRGHIVALCCALVKLARTAYFALAVRDHFIPLRNPADSAGDRKNHGEHIGWNTQCA